MKRLTIESKQFNDKKLALLPRAKIEIKLKKSLIIL
jgi:hypothetical protein